MYIAFVLHLLHAGYTALSPGMLFPTNRHKDERNILAERIVLRSQLLSVNILCRAYGLTDFVYYSTQIHIITLLHYLHAVVDVTKRERT